MDAAGELSAVDLPPGTPIERVVEGQPGRAGLGSRIWRVRAGFVLLPTCHAAGMNVVILLAFRFLTDNLAISAVAAGLIFGLVKVYDGLIDPLVGTWTDKADSRWGRRLPFVFAGGLLMPLSIVAIFAMPDFGSLPVAQIMVTLALALHATAYTALTIPGLAMAVEASDNFDERTSLMAFRVFGNSIGTLAGTTLPAMLLSVWGTSHDGHLRMSLVIAAMIWGAAMIAVWLLGAAPRTVPDPQRRHERSLGLVEQVRLAWRNLPFRILAIAHIFVLFGVSIASAAGAYFSKYVLGFSDAWLGSYFTVVTIGSVGSMPFWVWLTRRFGKKAGYILAMAAYAVLHLTWLVASKEEPVALLALRSLLIGVSAGGVILCAYSMMSDAVRYDYITSGLRREGAFSGFTTLFDKLAAAAGIALMGVFLGAMGYVSSRTANAVQPESARLSIALCVAVIPSVAMVAAILTILRYDLTEAMLEEPAR